MKGEKTVHDKILSDPEALCNKAGMQYISTRGKTEPMGFQDAILAGLAPDGGLLIPESIPDIRSELEHWATLDYPSLAFEVIRRFADIPDDDLRELINHSYSSFTHPDVAPLVELGDLHVLELFHGPTLAFKDLAMQFLSSVFDYILEQRDGHLNILGSTSGDTGSAAIHGVKGKKRINIFMMHPKGRTSPLQEKQMTSVLEDNVFNLAVDGTFDDCQRIMKSIFSDVEFKHRHTLGAVNSVNWARVLAQIVYYFYAGLRVMRKTGASSVRFAVPTGNFGNVLAGWYARQMGLPVENLILATNENDILCRLFNTGLYAQTSVVPTLSPSMDIQVASNFERYVYYHLKENSEAVTTLIDRFSNEGSVQLPLKGDTLDPLFIAGQGSTDNTIDVIRRYHDQYGYVLDPHSAVGVYVAEQQASDGIPMVCLATAHPAKFTEAIKRAIGENVHHPTLDQLADAPTRSVEIPADESAVRDVIVDDSYRVR